jgi:hypothetical protein
MAGAAGTGRFRDAFFRQEGIFHDRSRRQCHDQIERAWKRQAVEEKLIAEDQVWHSRYNDTIQGIR